MLRCLPLGVAASLHLMCGCWANLKGRCPLTSLHLPTTRAKTSQILATFLQRLHERSLKFLFGRVVSSTKNQHRSSTEQATKHEHAARTHRTHDITESEHRSSTERRRRNGAHTDTHTHARAHTFTRALPHTHIHTHTCARAIGPPLRTKAL